MKPINFAGLIHRCMATLIVSVSLGALSTNAANATTALAVGDSTTFGGVSKIGSFADTATFTLLGAAGISDVTSWTNVAATNVTGFSVTLSTTTGATIAVATQTIFSGSQLQSKLELPNLAAGTYNLTFAGIGAGSLGGRYMSTLTVFTPAMPVPEPESWFMLLIGTCIVGTIARRRVARRVGASLNSSNVHSSALRQRA